MTRQPLGPRPEPGCVSHAGVANDLRFRARRERAVQDTGIGRLRRAAHERRARAACSRHSSSGPPTVP
jgi:hypothetical protein